MRWIKLKHYPRKLPAKEITKIILLGLAALGTLGIITFDILTTSIDEVGKGFIANIQGGKAGPAYQYFSSNAQSNYDFERFSVTVDQLDDVMVGKPVKVEKIRQDQLSNPIGAQVTYRIAGNDGRTYTFVIELSKHGLDWFVYGYSYAFE